MNDPQPIDLRRRIRELLAIPDRDRTDAEWDELNELEIRTAPGNRVSDFQPNRGNDKRSVTPGQPRRPSQKNGNGAMGNSGNAGNARAEPRSDAAGQNREGRPEGRLMKRQHRRPKRPPNPQYDMSANGGGNAGGNAGNVEPGATAGNGGEADNSGNAV